jgi:hypothetical protein
MEYLIGIIMRLKYLYKNNCVLKKYLVLLNWNIFPKSIIAGSIYPNGPAVNYYSTS